MHLITETNHVFITHYHKDEQQQFQGYKYRSKVWMVPIAVEVLNLQHLHNPL